jgi:phosphodiesterase/alkaline phosphatase D-like protein
VDIFKQKAAEPNRYEYAGQLTSPGGGCPKEGSVPASNLLSVAVDSSGNVYVVMTGYFAARLYEFNFGCGDLPSSPLNPTGHVQDMAGVAVDGAGNIYAQGVSPAEGTGEDVFEYNSKGEWAEVDSAGSEAVAVNPANGEVFVVDTSGGYHVTRYDVTGSAVEEIEAFGNGEIEASSLMGSVWIAYSPNNGGEVYVADHETGEVHVYTEEKPGKPKVKCETPPVLTATSAKLTCAVDNPGSEPAKWQFEYATAKEYEQLGASALKKAPEPAGSVASKSEEPVEAEIKGLEPQTEYVYRLSASSKEGVGRGPTKGTLTFTTGPAVAGLTSCAATAVAGEEATLEAALNPEGALTEYFMQYGTSLAYGANSETKSSESGGQVVDIEPITELEPNKIYDCRLAATREIGGKRYATYGENGTFQTLPVRPSVVDEWPSSVGSTSAVLSTSISPENSPTSYFIEYVVAANYHGGSEEPYEQGQRVPAEASEDINVGEDIAYHTRDLMLEGLAPGATYHFRVVATNDKAETTYGKDATFTAVPTINPVASGVTQTGAVVSAAIEPEGVATGWTLEFGTTNEYGSRVSGMLGAGMQPETVSVALQGLAPATTYHFRLWTTNTNGPSYSADETFTTQLATVVPSFPLAPTSSLTLPSTSPLLATPPIAFPPEVHPIPPPSRLEEALKACKRRPKHKRAACKRKAHRKYGPPRGSREKGGKYKASVADVV